MTMIKNERGQLHCEDGPAFIDDNGVQKWFREGKLHREDGPAVIHDDGTVQWWFGDQLHREDGPAVIFANQFATFYHHGRRIDDDGLHEWLKENNMLSWPFTPEQVTLFKMRWVV